MKKNKYVKGERIWSLEELDNQEFIFWNGKVYHEGFWKSWQFRWITDRLKSGQLYKAEKNIQPMFVCYEENRHCLAAENGAITDLCIKKDYRDAVSWIYDRLYAANASGFIIDNETEGIEGKSVSETSILTGIGKGYVSITMFAGHQENWNESYDIVVEVKEAE